MANRGRALADRIITYFGDNQPGYGRGITLEDWNQIALMGVEEISDLTAVLLDLELSGLMGFVTGVTDGTRKLQRGEYVPMILTLKGWDRYEHLKQANPQSTTAFMAMSFGDQQMNRIYSDHFRPTVQSIGYDLCTVEDRPEAGLIDYRIRLQVTASRFVLADLTHENRGVYFEAGYAEGIGRPVIFTCHTDAFDPKMGRPHFDVSHQQCVKWNDPPTPAQLVNAGMKGSHVAV